MLRTSPMWPSLMSCAHRWEGLPEPGWGPPRTKGPGGRAGRRPRRPAALGPPPALPHPLALAQHERERLLDVDVLARGAGEDRHQRVPVIGRRDDDRGDVRAPRKAPARPGP